MLKSTLALIATVVVTGCASPQEKAKDAQDAQHEADEKSAHAGDESAQKAGEIQKNADAATAQSNQDGANKVADAQADANKKSAEAQDALVKARLDAQSSSEKSLTDLEKQFADLKPKLVKKLSKADSKTVVDDLTAKSEAVRKSIGELATATADSLEPVKATVAQRLKDFEKALEEAKKRV